MTTSLFADYQTISPFDCRSRMMLFSGRANPALAELTGKIEEACVEDQPKRVATLCDGLDASVDAALANLRALQL